MLLQVWHVHVSDRRWMILDDSHAVWCVSQYPSLLSKWQLPCFPPCSGQWGVVVFFKFWDILKCGQRRDDEACFYKTKCSCPIIRWKKGRKPKCCKSKIVEEYSKMEDDNLQKRQGHGGSLYINTRGGGGVTRSQLKKRGRQLLGGITVLNRKRVGSYPHKTKNHPAKKKKHLMVHDDKRNKKKRVQFHRTQLSSCTNTERDSPEFARKSQNK